MGQRQGRLHTASERQSSSGGGVSVPRQTDRQTDTRENVCTAANSTVVAGKAQAHVSRGPSARDEPWAVRNMDPSVSCGKEAGVMPQAPGDTCKLKDENEAGDRWTKEQTRAVSQVRASQGVRTPSGTGAALGTVPRPAAPPPDPRGASISRSISHVLWRRDQRCPIWESQVQAKDANSGKSRREQSHGPAGKVCGTKSNSRWLTAGGASRKWRGGKEEKVGKHTFFTGNVYS